MSFRASPSTVIPAETIRIAHAAFPKGTLCIQMRDTLGPIYDDDQFAALFSSTGQPAEAPARLALVLVLQFAEGLSDRQAADAVRGRTDWKYAHSTGFSGKGCHCSAKPAGGEDLHIEEPVAG
jgi:transposase